MLPQPAVRRDRKRRSCRSERRASRVLGDSPQARAPRARRSSPNRPQPRSAFVCASFSLRVGLDPDGLDDPLAWHARVFARAFHAVTRGGLEQAEDELVAGKIERSLERRPRYLPTLETGTCGR